MDSDWSDLDDSDLGDWSDLFSSDSSDEYDLEKFYEPLTSNLESNKHLFEETVSKYDEETFINHYRVSQDIAAKIADSYQKSSYYKEDKHGKYGKISAIHQVSIFLWFAGHQTSSFKMVSERFKISMSSLHRIIRRLAYFLSNLSPQVIKWPNEEEKKISEAYFRKKGFPKAIGVLDSNHIKINKPENDPDSYFNKKGYYSIQMQIVCDHRYKIIDIFLGYPGSVTDGRVFKHSPLSRSIQRKCGSYVLLGDSAYPLLRNLMIPFKDKLDKEKTNYNVKLSENWSTVERCFGLIKQKFRHLHHIKLKRIPVIVHFIRACCVLHNIALDSNLNINDKEQRPAEESPSTADLENEEVVDEQEAIMVREAIVDLLSV